MSDKFNLLVAERVMEEGPPEGHQKIGDYWEKELPDSHNDGSYARPYIVCTWPLDYQGNIAATWRVHQKACSWRFSKRRIYFEALDDIIQKRCRNTRFAPLNSRYKKVAWPSTMQFLEIGDFSLAALRAAGVPEAEIQEALDE